jgi:soluble P-type ATPase
VIGQVDAAETRITVVAADMVDFAETITRISAIKADLFLYRFPKEQKEKLDRDLKKREEVVQRIRIKYQKQ